MISGQFCCGRIVPLAGRPSASNRAPRHVRRATLPPEASDSCPYRGRRCPPICRTTTCDSTPAWFRAVGIDAKSSRQRTPLRERLERRGPLGAVIREAVADRRNNEVLCDAAPCAERALWACLAAGSASCASTRPLTMEPVVSLFRQFRFWLGPVRSCCTDAFQVNANPLVNEVVERG